MFQTKKDVDKHVRSSLARLKENEKNFRGYAIAKLYYKIGEYNIAVNYVTTYLSVNDNCAAAHKFIGQCYEKLKKPDKALVAYQRSLELDKKQSDLLVEVCRLLQMDELSNVASSKARYYYELAESRNIQHDDVLNLKLKCLEKSQNGNGNKQNIHDLILKEVKMRPFDIGLRIRLLRHFLDQNKADDAFKYAYDIEMKQTGQFRNSSDWYLIVNQVLTKYKANPDNEAKLNQNWPFWLLSLITLERQVYLSLAESPNDSNAIAMNLTEATNYLFDFDQTLNKISGINACPEQEKELNSHFFSHFRGQLCLHAATLLFKREMLGTPREQWYETTRNSLPLLLLAYNCGVADSSHPSLRNSAENTKQLVNLWNVQSAFRCSQAGRTLISCVDVPDADNNTTLANFRRICNEKYPVWSSCDEILTEIRRITTDSEWRKRTHHLLFSSIAQDNQASSSYFVKCSVLQTPTYDWPQISDLETYEEIAQKLEPSSLSNFVYLALGFDVTNKSRNTTISSDIKCLVFSELNFSVANLAVCGAETLNRLDIDTFLYAATMQAKRSIEVEKYNGAYGNNRSTRPKILPFANVANRLCTEEQANWWKAAYKVYNNISGDELAELRATLLHGIEAVRGVSGPKIDIIILLKLAQIFCKRSHESSKLSERNFLEARTEALFKYGVYLIRMQNSGRSSNESFRKLFKYSSGGSQQEVDTEIDQLTEEAITFLAGRYFKNSEYEECIEDLSGIKLPFATYFQAEACRKITELSNTPKKNKRVYLEKARDYLAQTLDLLNKPNIDKNHPLKSIVDTDIKRLQQESRKLETNHSFNDSFVSASNTSRNEQFDLNESTSRARRDIAPVIINNNENVEKLIREMMASLTLLKDDVADIRVCVQAIEDKQKKSQNDTASVDPLEDYYLLEDDLQQAAAGGYMNNTSMFANMSRTPNQSQLNSFQTHQQSFGIHQDPAAAAVAALNMNNSSGLYRDLYNGLYNGIVHPNSYAAAVNTLPNSSTTPNRNTPQQLQLQRGNYQTGPFTVPYGSELLGNYNMMTPQLQQYSGYLPQQQQQLQQQIQTQNISTLPNVPQAQPLLQQALTIQSNSNVGMQQAQEVATVQPLPNINQQQVLKSWNTTFNNAPVEKGPPVNVVITSSDPLPAHTTVTTVAQSSLSVTIPPQHIKNTVVTPTPPSKANPAITAALQDIPINQKMPNSGPKIDSTEKNTASATPSITQQKNIFGNLSTKPLSSTPISSPSLKETSPADKNKTDATKPNPFAGFSFGTNAISTKATSETKSDKPFFSGFGLAAQVPTQVETRQESAVNFSNSSHKEDDDDYVPTAHFDPVISLPDLVEVKTGEENEEILFEHRAKLLRYVRDSKEWKERGIGNMKVLVNKSDANQVRLLMRREQVFKLCCNQMLSKDTNFKKLQNSEVAMSWYGQDYSENELQIELLAIRFKTAEICKQFHDAILKAQGGMIGGTSIPDAANKRSDVPTSNASGKPSAEAEQKSSTQGFGEQFKPKAGSWTCEGCYLTNKAAETRCPACNTPKDKNTTDAASTLTAVTSKFSFGSQPTNNEPSKVSGSVTTGGFTFGNTQAKTASAALTTQVVSVPASTTSSGFGDKFKPKPGSWSCKDCYTSNAETNLHCLACEAPRDDTVPKKEPKNIFDTSGSTSKFTFGRPIESTNQASSTNMFGTIGSSGGFQFGNVSAASSSKPIDIPKIESQEFGFVFKPKSPGKAKSPLKPTQNDGIEDVSDDDNVEEEENNTYFIPVIALPDKIDVKTGEEEEEVLYTHRAKLFRFKDSEWRERGLGDVKILQHKTGKMRVVMRRDQILKICLNHVLDRDVEYKQKDDKSWHFIVNDFSEGQYEVEQLCLRFKTAEIAQGFKKAIDDALNGVTSKQNGGSHYSAEPAKESLQSKLSTEENKKIVDLKLPLNFFDFETVEKCTGCRGCNSDNFKFPEVKQTNLEHGGNEKPLPLVFTPITLIKTIPPQKQNASIFGSLNTSKSATDDRPNNSFFFGTNSTTKTGSITFGEKGAMVFGSNAAPQCPTTTLYGEELAATNTQNQSNKTDTQKTSFSFANASATLFGGSNATAVTASVFNNTKSPSIFGGIAKPLSEAQDISKPLFGSGSLFGPKSTQEPTFGGNIFNTSSTTTQPSVTTSKFTFSLPSESSTHSPTFGNISSIIENTPKTTEVTLPTANVSFAALAANVTDNSADSSNLFKNDPGLSFSALAQSSTVATNNSSFGTSANASGGFFGLSTRDDFSNLMVNKPNSLNGSKTDGVGDNSDRVAEDVNYDPHYDPIIALPDEITVTTGEEDEQKLFGDRAKLYRFDAVNKEWKERGVGEIKLLHHSKNNSYRLLLRREQVYKCVLNQAVNGEFQMNRMKQSDKAFCWVGTNFAEDTSSGAVESLSIRFKNAIIAQHFEEKVTEAVDKLKARGELGPEDD